MFCKTEVEHMNDVSETRRGAATPMPVELELDADRAAGATGSHDQVLQTHLIKQLLVTLAPGKAVTQMALDAMIPALEAIAPKDGIEGMLAAQMVATHDAAMACLRLAAMEDQSLLERDLHLKHAAKLLQIYTRQVEALNRHRGKGHQHIRVEHVTVQEGGQAIVGHVEASPR
jgi:hypothetical protein